MTDSIVYVDQSRVRSGRLAELEGAMADLAAFVEENVPDVLAYNVYFDPDGTRMTVVHVHEDQATLEHLLEVAGPKFPPIGAFIELESIDVYGRLTDDMVQRLREKASTLGSGRVTIHERLEGVERFANG